MAASCLGGLLVVACLLAPAAAGRAESQRPQVLVDDAIAVFRQARDEVVRTWRPNPNLVCATSALCGPVEKRASGSVLARLYARTNSIDEVWPEVAAGMPLFSGIQIYISQKFKFIYIRQPKASSSSIMTLLQQMYCAASMCEEHEFARVHVLHIDDAVWASYFVFTAIRNPISRMLSTYQMFVDHLRYRRPGSSIPGPPCNIPFLDFSQSVLRLRTICDTDNCCAYVGGAINDFVDKLVNAHITQMAHAIFTPGGASVVDYIACTENIDVGWAAITAEIGQRSGIAIEFRPLPHANSAKARGQLRTPRRRSLMQERPRGPACVSPSYLQWLNETTMLGLAQQFAADLLVLRYYQPPQIA